MRVDLDSRDARRCDSAVRFLPTSSAPGRHVARDDVRIVEFLQKKATTTTLVAHPGAATINGKRRAIDGASSAEEGELSDGGASHTRPVLLHGAERF